MIVPRCTIMLVHKLAIHKLFHIKKKKNKFTPLIFHIFFNLASKVNFFHFGGKIKNGQQ
jgi:hypothetical protein